MPANRPSSLISHDDHHHCDYDVVDGRDDHDHRGHHDHDHVVVVGHDDDDHNIDCHNNGGDLSVFTPPRIPLCHKINLSFQTRMRDIFMAILSTMFCTFVYLRINQIDV